MVESLQIYSKVTITTTLWTVTMQHSISVRQCSHRS